MTYQILQFSITVFIYHYENDIQWPLTHISKICHYSTLNISKIQNRDTVTMDYYAIYRICHFWRPWV